MKKQKTKHQEGFGRNGWALWTPQNGISLSAAQLVPSGWLEHQSRRLRLAVPPPLPYWVRRMASFKLCQTWKEKIHSHIFVSVTSVNYFFKTTASVPICHPEDSLGLLRFLSTSLNPFSLNIHLQISCVGCVYACVHMQVPQDKQVLDVLCIKSRTSSKHSLYPNQARTQDSSFQTTGVSGILLVCFRGVFHCDV